MDIWNNSDMQLSVGEHYAKSNSLKKTASSLNDPAIRARAGSRAS